MSCKKGKYNGRYMNGTTAFDMKKFKSSMQKPNKYAVGLNYVLGMRDGTCTSAINIATEHQTFPVEQDDTGGWPLDADVQNDAQDNAVLDSQQDASEPEAMKVFERSDGKEGAALQATVPDKGTAATDEELRVSGDGPQNDEQACKGDAAGIHYISNLKDSRCKGVMMLGYGSPESDSRDKDSKPTETKAVHMEQLNKEYPALNLMRIALEVCAPLTLVRRGNTMRYYTGRCYRPLTMQRFMNTATYALPEEMQRRIKSLQPLRDAYKYHGYMRLDEPDAEVTDYWVTFENGDVNVRTGELTVHSPDHLTFFEVNARYTPDDISCPHMDQLLNFMTGGDRVSIQLAWEMIAFLMLDTPPQRAFFYIGMAPASGKNVLGEFIGRLFGEEECHYTNAEKLGDQFGLAGFYSRRICLGLESQGNLSRSAITAIKAVTGNDKLSIERKGYDREDIKNRTRLIMASNDPLSVNDDAFWDRCKIIPAVQSCPPEQRDSGLAEKIWAERDAIATCAIVAAQQLIERDFRFVESEYALALKKEWRHEAQDSLSNFFEEQVEFVPGAEFVPTCEIYKAYMAGGYDPMKERSFAMKIKDKIGTRAKKDKVGRENGYWGLRLQKLEE